MSRIALACLGLALAVASPLDAAQGPYGGTPRAIPGLIEVEDFDTGGDGVAYHDIDPVNNGPVGSNYRPSEGVDIEATPDGSGSMFHVGWTQAGEWLNYTVDVAATGQYTLTMRAAAVSSGAGGTVHLELDGVNVAGPIEIVNGVWLGYSTIRVTGIPLSAGRHVLTLSMDANSTTGWVGNFNWMHFELTDPAPVVPPVQIQDPRPGSTFYVAPDGSDLNPGSLTQPWKTLAKAASTLTAGQAVYVRAGIYSEVLAPQHSGNEGNYIVFSAYPGEEAVIDGRGIPIPRLSGLVNIHNKRYIRVTGFHVVNAGTEVADGTWNFGISAQASDHVVIDRNRVAHTYSIGIDVNQFSSHVLVDGNEVTDTNFGPTDNEVALFVGWFSHHVEVRNNFVHHGFNEGIDPVAGVHHVSVHHNVVSHMGRQGLYVDSWTEYQHDIEFFNNVSHDNGLINGNGGFAVSSEEGGMLENVILYNNLSYDNRGHGFIVTAWGTNSHRVNNVWIVNNTVYNNGQVGIEVANSEATNVVVRNNVVYANAGGTIVVSAGSVTQDHNLTTNPKFVNAAAADFHLQSGSPAIDAGSAEGAPDVDFDGRARPAGLADDIGAFEFAAVAAPPVLSSLTGPLIVGSTNVLSGSGFTAGTVVKLYVATASGAVAHGPYTPSSWSATSLTWSMPPSVPLGNGFGTVQVVNTDQGYAASNVVGALLEGDPLDNIPTILTLNGEGLGPVEPGVGVAHCDTVVAKGATVSITGRGFNAPLVNLFTASGNVGPLVPTSGWTATAFQVMVPTTSATGPASVQVVNGPYSGNVQSNAVSVVIGAAVTVSGVSVSARTVTVTGTGFSHLSVINLFNRQGAIVVNLGGLDGPTPKVPLTLVSDTQFTFTLPAGAQSGPAFVQVLNPPYIPFSSSGSDPDGAFTVP